MSLRPTRLHLQMILALVALAAVTVGFVVGVWAVFAIILLSFEVERPGTIALIPAALTLLTIAVLALFEILRELKKHRYQRAILYDAEREQQPSD